MALEYPNLPGNIQDEAPKHELVKDEPAIADAALTRGQSVSIVTSAAGRQHCNIAAAGAKAFAVMETVAAGALARLRHIGHAPVMTATIMPAGQELMADGAGNWAAHVNGNWQCGRLEWPTSGQAGHLARCWMERAYR